MTFPARILVFVSKRDRHIILETPRLALRQFTEDDTDNLFDLNSDPEVMRYLTGGRPTPREEIRDQIIPFHLGVYERYDRLGTWAAESAATGEFLGWFHLRAGGGSDTGDVELGYRRRRARLPATSSSATGCAGPRGATATRRRGRAPWSRWGSPPLASGGCSRTQ
jgi:RimJ/RimL family protein N-acetyltransferase